MPPSKDAKSSKTAHVMNLLRKNQPEPPPAEAASTEKAESTDALTPAASAPQSNPQPQVNPIIASLNEDAEISLEIKRALEEELKQIEPAAPSPTPQQSVEPTVPPVPAKEDFPPVPAQMQESPVVPAAPVQEMPVAPVAPVQAPSPEVPPVAPVAPVQAPSPEVPVAPAVNESSASSAEVQCYNMMQIMVEKKAAKYMGLFGLCCCPRCTADVTALALNNLQPKYVVMPPSEFVPRIALYERLYDSTVTAQLLRACKQVMENPNHTAK